MRSLSLPLLCASLALVLVGCGVGEAGNGNGEPGEPGENQLALECEATLTVSGTFAATGTPEPDGCTAEGTWTVQLAVEDDGGCPSVEVNSEYVYVVTRDEEELLQVAYQGDDANPDEDSYKPGSSGSTCRINSEHFATDLTEVLYIRAFDEGGTLTGSATYELWGEAPEES